MKKTLITLGFAAATILAANAQEVPAAEEQPQTTVQTQPVVEDGTLDSDTETMDDRALNDTDNTVTEPATQPVRDEINDMPMENDMPVNDDMSTDDNMTTGSDVIVGDDMPTQDDAVTEPLQEEPTEDNAYGDPAITPDVMQDDVTEDEAVEIEDEAIEMQGEDPNVESSMQDIPDKNADDQSYSTVQDENEVDPTYTPMTDQQEPLNAASNDSDQDVMTITEAELPEEVSNAFKDSEFAKASIENVYMLKDLAVDKLLQNNAEQIYIGEQNPDKIYQLQVKGDEGQNILYYNENGDLLGSASI
jgi:hypothetical protein